MKINHVLVEGTGPFLKLAVLKDVKSAATAFEPETGVDYCCLKLTEFGIPDPSSMIQQCLEFFAEERNKGN